MNISKNKQILTLLIKVAKFIDEHEFDANFDFNDELDYQEFKQLIEQITGKKIEE